MKTASAGSRVAIAMVMAFVTATAAIAASDDQPQLRIQAARQQAIPGRGEGVQLYNVALILSFDIGRPPEGLEVTGGEHQMVSPPMYNQTTRVMRPLPLPGYLKTLRPVAKGKPSWCTLFPSWPRCNV